MGDSNTAEERLNYALTNARAIHFSEAEHPVLIEMAELQRRRGNLKLAHELLGETWEPVGLGPYPLFHADAYNILAQIERDSGNLAAAFNAATEAYRKAWCDGTPFAYYRGLEDARALLKALDVPEPNLPAYDESKYESMPEVEIDPPDEFEAN